VNVDKNYIMLLVERGWLELDLAARVLDDAYADYLNRARARALAPLSYPAYRQLLELADELEREWRARVQPYVDTGEPMPPLVRGVQRELARQLDEIDALLGF